MSTGNRILLVEDDPTFCSLLSDILEEAGYELTARDDGKAALMALQRQSFDLVLSDLRLPGLNGLELFRRSRETGCVTPFILLTAFGTVEEAVAAMKEGVADFLTKPLKDPESLRALVRRTLAGSIPSAAVPAGERTVSGLPPDQVLFAGGVMQEVRRMLHEVAPTEATVLITGESGTGKELAAQAVHQASRRAKGPFVALNCAAVPENLLESELFGHEKGAFTGATQARQGKFELAAGGTLFLDEIGELPLSLQSRFLRVLQERIFERVGGSRVLTADVRVVAATNRDLADEVRQRRFREDLFYRLNVFPLHLPPLRERRDGLPLLVAHLLERAAVSNGAGAPVVTPAALAALYRYSWPGNIRELRNVLERALILARGEITTAELPEAVRSPVQFIDDEQALSLKERERAVIMEALADCGNNRRLTAEKLGISRRTLQYRLKEYGLVEP